MNVCYATNKKYYRLMFTSILSFTKHHLESRVHYFVFHDGITAKKQKKITSKLPGNHRVKFLKVENKNTRYNLSKRRLENPANYFRFLTPKLISVDKLLFLDPDTLIRKNLNELYKLEFRNECLLFARQIEKKVRSFNAGVMLLNLKLIRRRKIFDKPLKYLENSDLITKSSQELLYSAIKDNYCLLGKKYNMYEIKKAQLNYDASIVHFLGNQKPNILLNQLAKNNYYNEFKSYFRHTGLINFEIDYKFLLYRLKNWFSNFRFFSLRKNRKIH